MKVDLTGRKALIISDNGGLARVVELNLSIRLGMKVVKYEPGVGQEGKGGKNGDLDLLVLAISSPAKEPIVELARASLVERIGQVPLLIISDRPFHSEPSDHIVHLDFPFGIEALETKVREAVGMQVQPRSVSRGRGWPGNTLVQGAAGVTE
jgi:hypothetical protein